MSETHTVLLVATLAGALLLAGVIGHRSGDDRADVRLMLGSAAALGGLALILLSFLQRN